MNPLGRGRRLAAACGVGAAPSSLLSGLVAYWKLDEASGDRADSGPNALHLTDNNTVTQAVGKVGNAGQFTRANSEFLSHAGSPFLLTGDIDYTFAAWVYFDTDAVTQVIIGNGDGLAGGSLDYGLFGTPSVGFSFTVDDASTVVPLGVPGLGSWHLFVCWYDSVARTINGQMDNAAPSSTPQVGPVGGLANGFYLGNDTAARFVDGRIDEVGFWKRVLTADERTALYNGGAGVTYPAFA